jgi:hypothetical protein
MRTRYENGTQAQVILKMAQYAIRDQRALIDAYMPSYGEPGDEAKQVIKQCESLIRDFKKLSAAIRARGQQ